MPPTSADYLIALAFYSKRLASSKDNRGLRGNTAPGCPWPREQMKFDWTRVPPSIPKAHLCNYMRSTLAIESLLRIGVFVQL